MLEKHPIFEHVLLFIATLRQKNDVLTTQTDHILFTN